MLLDLQVGSILLAQASHHVLKAFLFLLLVQDLNVVHLCQFLSVSFFTGIVLLESYLLTFNLLVNADFSYCSFVEGVFNTDWLSLIGSPIVDVLLKNLWIGLSLLHFCLDDHVDVVLVVSLPLSVLVQDLVQSVKLLLLEDVYGLVLFGFADKLHQLFSAELGLAARFVDNLVDLLEFPMFKACFLLQFFFLML